MNLSLPVSVISFSLEAFLMKALNDGQVEKRYFLYGDMTFSNFVLGFLP